jgi:hypothetical protein
MNHIGLIVFAGVLLIVWGQVAGALRRAQSRDSVQVWNRRPPRAVSQAINQWARTETPVRSSNTSSVSPTEVHMNPISALVFIIFVGGAVLSHLAGLPLGITIALAVVGVFLGYSIKMAQQWERAVILRLGKLHAVKGPGLFILIPIFDAVATWIDQRIRTTEVNAEQALTRDTVPVNVDAIVFWMVHDAERAALEIADYNSAVQRVAQTSLREMIGSSVLSEFFRTARR